MNGTARFAPQVKGYVERAGWSSDPINAAALGALDAKLLLRMTDLKLAGLKISRAVLRVALADSAVRGDIDDLQLYGGTGRGFVTAEPHGQTNGLKASGGQGLDLGVNLTAKNLAVGLLANDAAGLQQIDGRADVSIFLRGIGQSEQAIANSLNGKAQIELADGAIIGWNLPSMMRGLQSAKLPDLSQTSSERTTFRELAASFNIANGNAVTNDLRLTSPALHATGTGSVGIGARNFDLALRARLLTSMSNQIGAANGFELPVKLKGPWEKPAVTPDFSALAGQPGQMVDQARKLGQQMNGQSVGDIVRGVLGNDKQRPGQTDAPSHLPKQLNQLFPQ